MPSDSTPQVVSLKFGGWHTPVASQQPWQLLMLHAPPPGPEPGPDPGPESEHRPLWHVSPLVVQSRQVRPAVPQAVSLSVLTQVPPWQQPDAHVAGLQPPPPLPVPLEPPLLLPLELPLLLPLEPPLLPTPDVHIPAEQTCPFVVQFWQATPPIPHWASVGDEMQEGPRQHPLQTPQPPVDAPESVWGDPPPLELPLVPPPLPLLPLALPLPLLPKPPPFPLELPLELPLPPLVLLPPVELPLLPLLPVLLGES